MNFVAHNVASKLFVAFVAVAMLFTLATPAKAQTAAELQAQIDALMAQITSLTAQAGGGSVAAGVCPFTWTRSLNTGATGADVMKLQQFLNASDDTRVSATGVGSSGMETEYYGPATAAAVSKFQVKYRAEVLSPAGLVNPTGYFGPATMAQANKLCVAAPVVTPGDDTVVGDDTAAGDDDDDDSASTELSGEASLTTFEVADGEDADDVEEGSEDVIVAEFTVEFEDGDAMINRIDLALVGTGNTESDPWDVFEDVSLWVDGDEIDRKAVDDEDAYLDEDDGSIRFAGLDIPAMEDEEVTIAVAVTVTGSVDDAGSATLADWDVLAGSMRYTDADDVTSTENTYEDLDSAWGGNAAEFVVDTVGAGDDLDLESSDEDPDATTIVLDEDDNTEEVIFAFDLSAEDSDGDIDLNEVKVYVYVSSSTLDTIVNDFRLEINGDSYDAESYTGTGLGALVTFDVDGDTTVPADEMVTATLYADFENMDALGNEGTTIIASTTPSYVDAEGADDVTVDGSEVEGEQHTLRTEGLVVELTDESATEDAGTDGTLTDNTGEFTIEFTATAFGDTLYVPFGAASSTDLTAGVEYSVLNDSGVVVTQGSATASLDGEDNGETNAFKVTDDGFDFTLNVSYDPQDTGYYKVRIDAINFATTDAGTATESQDVSDLDIMSSKVQVKD